MWQPAFARAFYHTFHHEGTGNKVDVLRRNCRAKFVLTVKPCLYHLVHRKFDIRRNSYLANYMLLSFFSQFVSAVFSSGIFIKIRSFQNFSEATRPRKTLPYPPPPQFKLCSPVLQGIVDFIQVFLSFEVNSVLDAKNWAVDQTEAIKIAYFIQFSRLYDKICRIKILAIFQFLFFRYVFFATKYKSFIS